VKTALNRRQILRLAATMLLGAAVGQDVLAVKRDRLAAKLDSLSELGGLDRLRSLGRMCVDVAPCNQQQLFAAAGIGAEDDLQKQIAGFARKRQEDFALGRTQIVSGWVMAEAECALCVLCSQA
jgi:hypothetical protein